MNERIASPTLCLAWLAGSQSVSHINPLTPDGIDIVGLPRRKSPLFRTKRTKIPSAMNGVKKRLHLKLGCFIYYTCTNNINIQFTFIGGYRVVVFRIDGSEFIDFSSG